MPESTVIQELLSRWQNEDLSPEELCGNDPALCQRLKEVIQDLEFMEVFLQLDEPTVSKKIEPEPVSGKPTLSKEPAKRASLIACQWLDQLASGEKKTPKELCQDDAELLKLVKQVIFQASRFEPGSSKTPVDASSEPTQKKPGEKVDKYVLTEFLGQGGFGEVWKAWDTELERDVALKRPRPDLPISPQQIASFLSEAQYVAKLQHSHIVPIYHFGRTDHGCFLVSQFIHATNLSKWMRQQSLSYETAAQICADVAGALHHAHLSNIVHRDVKPANILVERKNGKAYLTDFGLSISEQEMYREQKSRMGTYSYMSPEQARGISNMTDARTDIYSLGVVLYYLLTGRTPFQRETAEEFVQDILYRQPRPPRTIKDDIPEELERICLKCLEKKVGDRYTTALDLQKDLSAWLSRQHKSHTSIADTANDQRIVPVTGRIGLPALALSVCCVGLLLLGAIYTFYNVPPSPMPTPGNIEFFDDTILPIKPNTTYDLLKWKPRLFQDEGHISWERSSHAYINAKNTMMVAMGHARKPGYQLKIRLKQDVWIGKFAIFFGFHKDRTVDRGGKPTPCAMYQTLQFEVNHGLNGPQLDIFRNRATDFFPDDLGDAQTSPLGYASLAPPKPGEALEIKMTISNKGLTQLAVQGIDVSELSRPRWNDGVVKHSPFLLYGDFGIIARESTLQVDLFQAQFTPEYLDNIADVNN